MLAPDLRPETTLRRSRDAWRHRAPSAALRCAPRHERRQDPPMLGSPADLSKPYAKPPTASDLFTRPACDFVPMRKVKLRRWINLVTGIEGAVACGLKMAVGATKGSP